MSTIKTNCYLTEDIEIFQKHLVHLNDNNKVFQETGTPLDNVDNIDERIELVKTYIDKLQQLNKNGFIIEREPLEVKIKDVHDQIGKLHNKIRQGENVILFNPSINMTDEKDLNALEKLKLYNEKLTNRFCDLQVLQRSLYKELNLKKLHNFNYDL